MDALRKSLESNDVLRGAMVWAPAARAGQGWCGRAPGSVHFLA